LRFYNFTAIPFVQDEFSALNRLNFSTFSELIRLGAATDGHPAGVQVFLYYYTHLFGRQEWVVKLPFLLSGLGSVYLVYRLGILFQNQFAATASASLMAATQYFVYFSQIARPYMAGTFFGLLATVYWYKALKSPDNKLKYYLGWSLAAAAACYIHHFALLLVGLIGLTGLFLFRKEKFKAYLLSCIGIFLLYIPHLSIFFNQLNRTGIGEWLDKPAPTFLWDFMIYFLQYSWVFALAVIASVLISFFSGKRNKNWFWQGLVWFGLTYLIAHIYSLKVNSVLQFSVLIFSFPFLVLSVFSLFPKGNFGSNVVAGLFILLAGTYALKNERKHYEILYQSPFEYLVKDTRNTKDSLMSEEPGVTNNYELMLDYYNPRYGLSDKDWLQLESLEDFEQVRNVLENKKENYLLLPVLYHYRKELPSVITEHFPHRLIHKRYYQGDFLVFSKTNDQQTIDEVYFKLKPDDKNPKVIWDDNPDLKIEVNENQEYALGVTVNELSSIYEHQHDIITLKTRLNFKQKPKKNALCSALFSEGQNINFQSSLFDEYTGKADSGSVMIYHSFSLPKHLLRKNKLELKLFAWNLDGQKFTFENPEIIIEKGNPKLFGLFEKLD